MTSLTAALIRSANSTLIVEGNLDSIDEYFTPDYVVHLADSDMKSGHEGIRKALDALRRSFPDLKVEVKILLEQDTRIAWQRTLRGTHAVAFKGFPGTGSTIVWRDMVVSQLREGRIAEEWVVTDLAEQLLLSRKRN